MTGSPSRSIMESETKASTAWAVLLQQGCPVSLPCIREPCRDLHSAPVFVRQRSSHRRGGAPALPRAPRDQKPAFREDRFHGERLRAFQGEVLHPCLPTSPKASADLEPPGSALICPGCGLTVLVRGVVLLHPHEEAPAGGRHLAFGGERALDEGADWPGRTRSRSCGRRSAPGGAGQGISRAQAGDPVWGR